VSLRVLRGEETTLPGLYPLGDAAVLAEFGSAINTENHQRVMALAKAIEERPHPCMIEIVPAFTTLTLFYEPSLCRFDEARDYLLERLEHIPPQPIVPSRTLEIPVAYGGEFGPDLQAVAEHAGLSTEEVVRLHSEGDYLVYMIGFSPGFPYLGGMSERIAAPRLATPRLAVPAGSVGIAGNQTGIYPSETPGGWQIVGRTPFRLFHPNETPPSRLKAGDRVRFLPISAEEYRGYTEPSTA
jgi:inhibitor of KinA